MADSNLKGVGTALVTPFTNGTVDTAALDKIINYNISHGVDFLVPLGTTGETSTLTAKECKQVMNIVMESNNGRLPIVCGMFAKNNTRAVIDAIREYDFDGIHSILLASPYYNKPSQAGLVAHFRAVADISPVPVILYNVPSRTSVNINAETTLALAEHPNIIAIKEASGDFNLIMSVLKHKPADFIVLSGDDAITLPMIACGSSGVISVISNAFPGIFSETVKAALHGDYKKAKTLNDKLLDVHKWLYIEGNPVGIKAALSLMGFCSDEVRLPLVSLSDGNRKSLELAIKGLY
jgi:4-hydroxy-tetrahydrodipicolinate synthase